MRRLLVTGGAGFIGSNFVLRWLRKNPKDRLVVLDALTYAGRRENLASVEQNPQFRFVHGDICNQTLVEGLLREEQLDTVVNFAAESHVDRSISGPDLFLQTNILGTHSLLKAAKKVWLEEGGNLNAHLFHHVSTDEVYGSLEETDPAFTELTPYAPNSPYSASKAASDHLVRAYHHTYGLRTTISNCSNNYGPYQFPEKLIPLVIQRILMAEPIPLYGDGKNVRDWLYVEDHCRGIESVMQAGRVGECYNIGGGVEKPNVEIVALLCQLVDERLQANPQWRERYPKALAYQSKDSASLVTFVADRAGHDRRYAINSSKAERELGYRPQESFETGIKKTLDWYLEGQL